MFARPLDQELEIFRRASCRREIEAITGTSQVRGGFIMRFNEQNSLPKLSLGSCGNWSGLLDKLELLSEPGLLRIRNAPWVARGPCISLGILVQSPITLSSKPGHRLATQRSHPEETGSSPHNVHPHLGSAKIIHFHSSEKGISVLELSRPLSQPASRGWEAGS